jgi:hypothetical protein
MAAGIPSFFFIFLWLVYIPKNAKTLTWAKVFRQTIFEGATDSGQIPFHRGHTEGPGVFRSHDGVRIDFIPRKGEGWINKMFHGDKIPYLLGYTGKAVASNPETLAVLSAHQKLLEHREKIKEKLQKLVKEKQAKHPSLSTEEMRLVLKDFLESNPEAKSLMQQLEEAKANIEKVLVEQHKTEKDESGKPLRRYRKVKERLNAILLDPRILQEYITATLQPSQARHVHDVGYRQGYRDGSNPTAKFKGLFIVIIIGAAVAGVVLLLLMMSGGGAAT